MSHDNRQIVHGALGWQLRVLTLLHRLGQATRHRQPVRGDTVSRGRFSSDDAGTVRAV